MAIKHEAIEFEYDPEVKDMKGRKLEKFKLCKR